MMKSFTGITFFLLLSFTLGSQSQAANIQSLKSGFWDDPSVWSTGTIPGPNDNVIVKVGHKIQSNQSSPNIDISSLTVEATGTFEIGNRNLSISGATNISGTFRDIDNGGNNLFVGKVSILAGGVWNTLLIHGHTQKNQFRTGIHSAGDSTLIRGGSFYGDNIVFSGTTQIYITKEFLVGTGSTVINENTAGMFFDGGQIRGEDSSATFINRGLLKYHDRNAPMTPGNVDFSPVGNTVIYGRRDKQFIRPAVHYNMIIDDYDADDENNKVLQAGITTVLNDLTINQHAEMEAEAHNLQVNGTTLIKGELFDGKEEGLITLNHLTIDGGKIHGHPYAYGSYIINGNFHMQGTEVILEDGALDVKGNTTIAAGTTVKIEGGGDAVKQFRTITAESGANFLDLGQNGELRFKEKLTLKGGALFLKQDAFFEKGFSHTGDTLSVQGPVTFISNEQEAHSTAFWFMKKPINIAAGIRAIINIERGLYVPKNNPYIIGENNTAIFANKGLVIFNENTPTIQSATPDFSEEGNELMINMVPSPYVELPGGDFYSLNIQNQKVGQNTLYCFLPFQTIHCRGDFTLGRDISLNPVQFDLQVDGWGRIFGEIFDNNPDGKINFGHLEMGRGIIDGNNWRKGNFTIAGNFEVSDTVSVSEADFRVSGMTTIKENGLLLLNTKEGDRSFGGLTIEEGGELWDNTQGEDFVFDGPINLAGALKLANGNCVFTHPVVISETGTLSFSKEWGTYNFTKGIINDGTVALGNGFFSVAGEVGGSAEITLNSDITVASGDTLVNTNTASFTVGGSLNGEDESSLFINKGVLNYATRTPAMPMNTGQFDAFTFPDNWVYFSSPNGWQEIESGEYRNIGFFDGGNKKLVGGNLDIHGDIKIQGTTVRKSQDPFAIGVARLVGTTNQHIEGDITGFFEDLYVEKPAGKVVLKEDFGITGIILMKSGIMEAKEGGLFLANNGFLQETEASYVIGKVATLRDICEGCGQEFGGLGLSIKSGNGVAMGPTRVIRHTGAPYAPGQITRYYEVYPTNNENLNAQVEFAYLEREINGAIEQDLDLVIAPIGGDFKVLGGKNLTKSNLVQKTKVQEFGIVTLVANSMPINAYPSPFTDGNLSIDYVLEEDTYVDLRIFDQTGRTFIKREVESFAGLNSFKLEQMDLGAGLYYIRIKAGDKVGYRTVQKITP